MTAKLVFLNGSRAGTSVPLGGQVVTIGRSPSRTVSYSTDEVLVSTEHASIRLQEGRYILKDDASRNGTFVNAQPVTEKTLEHGDLIQFGAGGPSARFVVESRPGTAPTLDLAAQTERRAADLARTGGGDFMVRTRDLVAITFQRMSVASRRSLITVAVLGLAGLIGLFAWQQYRNAGLKSAMTQLSLTLMQSQASLAQNLSQMEMRYAALRDASMEGERRMARLPRLELDALSQYSQGVALIVYSYGYQERNGSQFLRYVLDSKGQIATVRGANGQTVPRLSFGSSGPPVERVGVATGFLVDTAGFVLTNGRAMEPWEGAPELEAMRARGLDLVGKMVDVRAYFPPGGQAFPLFLDRKSGDADVAVLRIVGGKPSVPALALAADTAPVRVGEQLISIGYPAELDGLLFRASEADRATIREAAGEDARKLAAELAQRHLIVPVMSDGNVANAQTALITHTAGLSIGGAGAPLVNSRRQVVALWMTDGAGGSAKTASGVPIRYAWDILPYRIQRALGKKP